MHPAPRHDAQSGGAPSVRGLVPDGERGLRTSATDTERDRLFVTMLRAFRESGGVVRGDEVVELLTQRRAGDVARLARWIVSREVIAFDWRGELWVHLFQFHLHDMALRPEAAASSMALKGELDAWQVAVWFSTPHPGLDGETPSEALADVPEAVLHLARQRCDA